MFLPLQSTHKLLQVDPDFPLKHLKWYLQDGHPYSKHKSLFKHLLPNIPDGFKFEHINGDPLDCRLANLLIVHSSKNCWEIGLLALSKMYPLSRLGSFQANYLVNMPFTIPPRFGDDLLIDMYEPPPNNVTKLTRPLD